MQILKEVDGDFWWDVADACSYATFFHSPLWHRLIRETYEEFEDRTIGAVSENGTRMVLPLLKIGKSGKGLFQDVVSTFAGCYGGVIADAPLGEGDAGTLYEAALGGNTGRLDLSGNPLRPEADFSGLEVVTVQDDFTHILELNRDFDAIVSGFSKGHKSSMKKGRRMGVTVRPAETLDDYKAYFGAYEDSLRRWGDDATSVYPWKLFEKGCRLSQKHAQHIRLWLAEVEGEVVAGAWVFYWNRHVDWWHGAAYEEYFDHCPNNVLQADIIRDALARGYKYYDFNPSGSHEGVARFKGRFGAEKWPIKRWRFKGRRLKFAERVKGRFR